MTGLCSLPPRHRPWEASSHFFEGTNIILEATKAMGDSRAFDHRAARNLLEVAMRFPELWLTDGSSRIALPSSSARPCPSCRSPSKPTSLVSPKPPEGSREGWDGQLSTKLCPLRVPSTVRGTHECLKHVQSLFPCLLCWLAGPPGTWCAAHNRNQLQQPQGKGERPRNLAWLCSPGLRPGLRQPC